MPIPLESFSLFLSTGSATSLPTFSIAVVNVTSVYLDGGVVFDAFNSTLFNLTTSPPFTLGKELFFSAFASKALLHPASVRLSPFALKYDSLLSSKSLTGTTNTAS
ncbi:hypothetical protein D3C86_1848420 [compost metagenome]